MSKKTPQAGFIVYSILMIFFFNMHNSTAKSTWNHVVLIYSSVCKPAFSVTDISQNMFTLAILNCSLKDPENNACSIKGSSFVKKYTTGWFHSVQYFDEFFLTCTNRLRKVHGIMLYLITIHILQCPCRSYLEFLKCLDVMILSMYMCCR